MIKAFAIMKIMPANIKIHVDPNIEESLPDRLSSDHLQIKAGPTKYIKPGRQTTVKLTIQNFSSTGRMARVSATFDGSKLGVTIPIAIIYIAPQGDTAVYAIVRSYAAVGSHNICFNVS
jgi:hypothetical protein